MIRKKKKGFTLLELLIAMTISLMVMAMEHLVFLTGMKVFNDTNVKNDIQTEGQEVHQNISNKLMGAVRIKEIEKTDGTKLNMSDSDFETLKDAGFIGAKSITVTTAYEENEKICSKDYKFEVDDKKLKCGDQIITSNLYEKESGEEDKFKVKLSQKQSAQFLINLRKKKGLTDCSYPVKVDVLFRNSDVKIDK